MTSNLYTSPSDPVGRLAFAVHQPKCSEAMCVLQLYANALTFLSLALGLLARGKAG